MKTILVPMDFSLCSIEAAKVACNIARNKNAELLFLHCSAKSVSTQIIEQQEDRSFYLSHECFARFYGSNVLSGLNFKTLVSNCNVFQRMEEYIEHNKIELVVVGAHQSSEPTNKEVFSVETKQIIQTSSVPVIAVNYCDGGSFNKYFCVSNVKQIPDFKFTYLDNSTCQSNVLLHAKFESDIFLSMPLMKGINQYAKENVLHKMYRMLSPSLLAPRALKSAC